MKKINSLNKKSHLKFTRILMAGLMATAMMFASCSSDSGDSNDGSDKNGQAEAEAKAKAEAEAKAKEEAAKEAEKKQVREFYESVMGEWECYSGDVQLVLGKDIITFKYLSSTETVSTDPINDLSTTEYSYNYVIRDDNGKLKWRFWLKDDVLSFFDGSYEFDLTRVKSSSGTGGSGSSGSEGGENISVTGTYAGSDRYNSSIVMNDNGTWTFDTSKPGSAVSGGTYTVSGSKITMKYSARGTDFEETFTVTNSGSQSTWKTSQNGASTLFSTLFMEVGTEYTFIKS